MKLFSFTLFFLVLTARAEDQIDLQWAICDASPDSVAARLHVEADSKSGFISYYDSIPVSYLDRGVTFRVKFKKEKLESTVKLRFSGLRSVNGGDCEWDRYGEQEFYTCALSEKDVGERSPWTISQREFIENFERVNWKELQSFGPYPNSSWKLVVRGNKASLDTVFLPNGMQPLTELSVKVSRSDGDSVYREVTKELFEKGVPLCARQESKTERLFRELGLVR